MARTLPASCATSSSCAARAAVGLPQQDPDRASTGSPAAADEVAFLPETAWRHLAVSPYEGVLLDPTWDITVSSMS